MQTERRLSARHPLSLPVQILYGRRRFSRARARNLSLQGMLLEVRNVTLPAGTPIGLELDCLGREWSLQAVVVHRTAAGVGVMLKEAQPAIYQALIQGRLEGDLLEPRPVPRGPGRPVLSRR